MAFQEIKNIKIKGIASCVPEHIEDNNNLELIGSVDDIARFIDATGIEKRHTVGKSGLCTSDLCFQAAEKLIVDLGWQKEEITCLIFVTQTPDYILPATSCLLQDRLGLSKECFTLDISLGCSGWIYGLTTIASLMANGSMKKGLLLAGDTVTVTKSPLDKGTYPLFGDAGTATAIEVVEGAIGIKAHLGTDGKGYDSIIIQDGGFRNFFNDDSLKIKETEPGVFRNKLQSYLNGASVFTFGISMAPKSINQLIEHFEIDKDSIDFFVLHQANKFMNEKIRTKLKIDSEKVPYCLDEFGNTSSASIPLTINTRLRKQLSVGIHKILCCGFGVGLSWGSILIETEDLFCSEITYA